MSRRLVLPERIALGDVALSARGVSVAIDGTTILDGVDLDVIAGEVLALVGPNGAGKSTLLGVIAGDEKSSGQIELAGHPLSHWTIAELARHRAVLQQENLLSFPFTVLEVVEMGRAPWSRSALEDEDDDAVLDAMTATAVTGFAPRHFPTLSGGERARVSLARVLAQRTGIVMLDEPTAALDLRHQEDVLRVARERAAAGDAVVVVLHDLNLAAAYADRIALLERGRLRAVGAPAVVLTAELISDVYQYPVNVIQLPTGESLVVPLRARK
ncbi:heme ABC transporter ATP-binding protein [Glaciihabitans arcticus]|uniref:Heme ABC transporter ATP-binding protein n=1 Tax=Glaciihabitans arcticus TaxID=2668039 RepID=A0A4Q9GYH3_9MICO|nr:heme ABC transporter ATP-binding protein [Glaciihabitans arcticus]TBN57833.1 heme ABC transporter ATP-binding protein [Glaciihabitans arcticus]